MKTLEELKTEFKTLLGEAHILYGIIETELKSIWHVLSYKKKTAKPDKIEKKWKRISKMTLGQIIDEVDYFSVYSDNNIDILKNEITPERNYLTHNIQDIFYEDRRLTKRQNIIKMGNDLSKSIRKIKVQIAQLRTIAHDLNVDRQRFEK